MIVSETPYRVTSRWLQACVLLCAMVVLPFGMAYAQDYDAVGKRLRGAVQAGELTGEQARAMLGALRKTAEHEGQRNVAVQDERVAKYRDIEARIRAAVKAGVMSREDAEKKLVAIRTEMWPPEKKRCEKNDERVAKYRDIEARIKAAVKAGVMSREDAEKKLVAIRTEMWPPEKKRCEKNDEGGLEVVGEYLRGIGERIRGAVAEGKLSEEDGWAKWHEVKEKVIKGAVKSGKISREEAGLLWREIEKGEAATKLKIAVEKGELTEEEARAKWAEISGEDEDEVEDEEDDEEDDEHAGIQPVPAEAARAIGKALLEAAPMNFAGDPSQAVGVFAKDDGKILGMILIPTEGLNEDDAEMEIGETEPLALLFCSPSILPATDDGTLIDRDKLHGVTITDGEGNEHDSNCVMLVVKRIAEEDYRLYGIGKNANEPLIDGRFDDGEGPGQTPLAVEVEDIDEEDETAAVVITVFNKYQAAFRAGVLE